MPVGVNHAGAVSVRDDPRWPPTRYAEWRLVSPVSAALDGLTIILGSILVVVPVAVALATWPSDRVLVSPTDLEHWAAVALIPGWGWLMVSSLLFYGVRQDNYRRRWGSRLPSAALAAITAVTIVCAITIAGGLFIGAAKGSLRVASSAYEVSTGSLNGGRWTSVSLPRYRSWEAKFLRLDSFFSLFGLVMLADGAQFRWLSRGDRAPSQDPDHIL
jgi:hypothetical protein